MNWISENKFLTGFFGFVIVGLGALGFLLFQAMGNYSAVHDEYVTKVQTLKGLQDRPLYPNSANLNKYRDQKTMLAGIIGKLQENLAAIQFPMDPAMTPGEFQDKLRASVNSALAKARLNSVKLPDKFALGFDTYLSSPPAKEAAPALGRELAAIDNFITELLDNHVVSIAAAAQINRIQLPEEIGGKPVKDLVTKAEYNITFVCSQANLRKILDDLAETKKQFYIVRNIQIKNQGEAGLTKKQAFEITRKAKPGVKLLVLGDEKLEVALKLEVVNFNLPQK